MARPNRTPPRIKKRCEWCDAEFEVVHSRKDSARFCSRQCLGQHKSYHGSVWKKCVICGKTFKVNKSDAHQRKTCGDKSGCGDKSRSMARHKRVKKHCLICGKGFHVPWSRRLRAKYCSKECRDKAKAKVKHRPNKLQLEHLIQNQTIAQIANMYGVTYYAVRYWLEKEGIHIPGHRERRALQKKRPETGASHRGPRS